MSEARDAFRFKSKIFENGRIAVPMRVLSMAKLSEGDHASFELLPTVPGIEKVQSTAHEIEVQQRVQEAEELGMATFNAYLPMWMKNFRASLDLLPPDAVTLSAVKDRSKGKKAIVVGAGPSLKNVDWFAFEKPRKNTVVVATNKTLIPLLKHDIVPDWVVALDGLPEVYNSFNDPVVKDYKDQVGFLGPTVLDPTVIEFALKWAKECVWGNPHIPSGEDSEHWNLNLVMELMNGLEMMRHGGNVGTAAWLLAKHLGCNPIGLLGFDLCFYPDPTWKKEDCLNYEFFYNPETDEVMALDSPFKAYLSIITDVTDMAWSEGIATVNLSDTGTLHSSSLYPNMTLKKYLTLAPKTIITRTRGERERAVTKIMERIKAVRESQKPIFRAEV